MLEDSRDRYRNLIKAKIEMKSLIILKQNNRLNQMSLTRINGWINKKVNKQMKVFDKKKDTDHCHCYHLYESGNS